MPSSETSRPGGVGATADRPTVGVAIVSWNVSTLLARCLESVRAAELGRAARVVVVDNASRDGTVGMLQHRFPDVALIANPDNRGFARGNNQALAALGVLDGPADGDGEDGPGREAGTGARTVPPPYVLLLNPDTEIAPDALVLLVDHLARHPRAACVGPQLRYPDGTVQSSRRRFPTLASGLAESTPVEWHWPDNRFARHLRMADVAPDVGGRVDWVNGSAMLLRGEALRAAGGFDERYFMYSEELDLCRRLAAAGWQVRYEPRAVVIHHEGQSSGQAVSARHLRFARSRVRYFRRHHGALSAGIVRSGLLAGYAAELALESAKWLVGHQRPLRRARVATYAAVLRDGLGPGPDR
jgi:N-acetylglucosaminyl-diphospho-decaprenol L-rhamnosyltransferase